MSRKVNSHSNKFEGIDARMSSTLSLSSKTMSPFADKPELWLTGHLERQKHQEVVVKIQAVVKGFLQRRRSTEDSIAIAIDNLQPSKNPITVPEFLRLHGLTVWADACPPIHEALLDGEANTKREECLWHAKVTLRLQGKAKFIPDLEWYDYHERNQAILPLAPGTPREKEDSLWAKLTKLVLG
jgi:hypothetical protein